MSPSVQATDFLSLPEFTVAILPAEDRVTFESLSTSDSELSAWANACESKYRQQISELETYIAIARSLRNTCSPISRLPNEILADVFADSSLILHTHIRRVCRRWRSVLLGTSSFWAKCISRSYFNASVRDQTFLCAALRHSGALSISIELEDTDPESSPTIWNTLSEHHARIAELSIEARSLFEDDISSRVDHLFHSRRMDLLHRFRLISNATGKVPSSEEWSLPWDHSNLPALRTLQVSSGVVSPSMVVASLTTLSLDNVHLALSILIDVLNRCPLLETLQLGLNTSMEVDLNIADRTIWLPHLRKVTITETRRNMARLLGYFKSQSFSTRTLLTLHCMDGLPPAIDCHPVFAPPQMHRLCIDSDEGRASIRVFCDFSERLRISCKFGVLHNIVETFISSISVLIVHSSQHRGVDSEYSWAIQKWSLSHLQRLELSHTFNASHKPSLAKIFLERFGHRASELSLAWVLPIHAGQKTQSLAEEELQNLVGVFQKLADSRKPCLGRLELYAVEKGKWKPFKGSIEVGSDARLCAKIVEPFLADLRTWVNVVHVG